MFFYELNLVIFGDTFLIPDFLTTNSNAHYSNTQDSHHYKIFMITNFEELNYCIIL
jgi:hypothetical protein